MNNLYELQSKDLNIHKRKINRVNNREKNRFKYFANNYGLINTLPVSLSRSTNFLRRGTLIARVDNLL